jgi:hypothetical protein
MKVVSLIACFVLCSFPVGVGAQEQQQQPAPTGAQPEQQSPAPTGSDLMAPHEIQRLNEQGAEMEANRLSTNEAQDRRDALDDFKKGAGLGISVVLGKNDDVVDSAIVVDGKIVVTRRSRDQVRATLEAHQLFTNNPFTARGRKAIRDEVELCADNTVNCPLIGIGPFAAIQTGSTDSVSSVGLGVMLGVRSDPRQDSSFNLGVGIVFDNAVKELAPGFVEGQALPTGQTAVQFTENSARRLMLTLSFAF